MLGTERERLAVFLAVEEQVPLIAFEHRPRNFDGFAQAVFMGPFDEEADVNETVLHRELGVAAHPQCVQVLAHEQLHRRLRRGLGFALLLDASHHFTAAMLWAAPFGLCMGTTTTGVCGTPLDSAPLYMCFPLLAAKASSARAVTGDSVSCPPCDTPVSWP